MARRVKTKNNYIKSKENVVPMSQRIRQTQIKAKAVNDIRKKSAAKGNNAETGATEFVAETDKELMKKGARIAARKAKTLVRKRMQRKRYTVSAQDKQRLAHSQTAAKKKQLHAAQQKRRAAATAKANASRASSATARKKQAAAAQKASVKRKHAVSAQKSNRRMLQSTNTTQPKTRASLYHMKNQKLGAKPVRSIKTSRAVNDALRRRSDKRVHEAKRFMQRKSFVQKKTVERVKVARKAFQNMLKGIIAATRAIISAIIGACSVALTAIFLLMIVAALLTTTFGIFLSSEKVSDDVPTMIEEVAKVNSEFEQEIENIKAQNAHDEVRLSGVKAPWKEVLAMYAVYVNTDAENGTEVLSLEGDKPERLRTVFWDMNEISYDTQTETTTVSDGEKTKTVTKTVLYIKVTSKTVDETIAHYSFDERQTAMTWELLATQYDELWDSLLTGISGGYGFSYGVNVSAEVLAHKPMLEKYAAQYGISEYVNVLLAIMQVESGGTLTDVMQSSESAGLPPNTLGTEESIKQGCNHFSALLKKAERLGCDFDTVIQSYNYGSGFIDYVAKNGCKYTFALAESFAKNLSGGVKVTYKNDISIPINGGWRYHYGNMFYVLLVKQYYGSELGSELQNRIVAVAQNYKSYGITAPAGYCEMWAEQVYRAAGININNICCAGRNRVQNTVSTDINNIPVGAMVYNNPSVYNSRTNCSCGLNAGHVGIYLGNGQIMSNIGGCTIDTVESWTAYYGFGGWGYGGGAVS